MTARTMIGIDTNVLLRAYAPESHPHRKAAQAFLTSLTPENVGFISQLTLAEFYWSLRRSHKLPTHRCLALVNALLQIPVLEFEDDESIVYALDRAEDGADFPDALIAQTCRLFGARESVTFDRRAARKLGWELLDATDHPMERMK